MIDTHCHILPGVDDGPKNLDESLEMCRIAVADGVKTIVATPHYNPGKYESSSFHIFDLINNLQSKILSENLDLKILPGAEITITPELLDNIKKEEYLTYNKYGKYVLVEFPFAQVLPNWDMFLISLLDRGIIPIIAHPERNRWFLNNQEALYNVVGKGVMVQVSAMSITGEFGPESQRFSFFLLEHNLAHIIASDAHSLVERPPILSKAIKLVQILLGVEKTMTFVNSTPATIIEGKFLSLPKPIRPRQRKKSWIERMIAGR